MSSPARRVGSRGADADEVLVMECPKCKVRDVIQIELKLPDGTEVHFCSCHKCDAKWWHRDGRALALEEVLDLARRPPS